MGTLNWNGFKLGSNHSKYKIGMVPISEWVSDWTSPFPRWGYVNHHFDMGIPISKQGPFLNWSPYQFSNWGSPFQYADTFLCNIHFKTGITNLIFYLEIPISTWGCIHLQYPFQNGNHHSKMEITISKRRSSFWYGYQNDRASSSHQMKHLLSLIATALSEGWKWPSLAIWPIVMIWPSLLPWQCTILQFQYGNSGPIRWRLCPMSHLHIVPLLIVGCCVARCFPPPLSRRLASHCAPPIVDCCICLSLRPFIC
jgi:hypothetical protein